VPEAFCVRLVFPLSVGTLGWPFYSLGPGYGIILAIGPLLSYRNKSVVKEKKPQVFIESAQAGRLSLV